MLVQPEGYRSLFYYDEVDPNVEREVTAKAKAAHEWSLMTNPITYDTATDGIIFRAKAPCLSGFIPYGAAS